MRNTSLFKQFYCMLIFIGDHLQSLFLLGVRIFWGWQFFQAGLGKLSNIADSIDSFKKLGILFPEFSAYLTGITECVGGLLLLVGFASRLAAIPLAITMITAYFTAHKAALQTIWEDPFDFVQQSPFTFLLASLLIFVFGPGKFSIDNLICMVKCREKR